MKRDDIIAKWETLGPRERDAWVAEVVFRREAFGQFREVNGVRVFIPFYTTDISAAWTVLDKIRKYLPTINVYTRTVGVELEYGISVETESAPEAICLAALIARLTED